MSTSPCARIGVYYNVPTTSCVGVCKNGGVETISNSQRNRMCLDADVKPIGRDPMSEGRILVESGAEMTIAGPSEFEKTETSSHSHPIPTMVHVMRQRQSTGGNHTNE